MREQGTPGPASLHNEAAETVIAAIRALNNPSDRFFAIGEVLHNNSGFVSQLAALTRENVRQMKETMSYGQIAAELGISRSRAQQLAADPTARSNN